MSFVLSTVFPTIAGEKIPLHYYSLLYPYLNKIWSKAYSTLRSYCSVEAMNKDLFIECSGGEIVDALVVLHSSFFTVNGFYTGEYIDRREFLRYLVKTYRPRLATALGRLASSIRGSDYDKAYEYAVEALRAIAGAEKLHMETGGRLNQLYFDMLHGGIPVTFINTWRLCREEAAIVKKIAPEIYSSVAEESERTSRILLAGVKRQ